MEKDNSMKHFTFSPKGVCSQKIDFDIDAEGCLRNIRFTGGCPGNTFGVATLCEGARADEVVTRLEGIDCRGRGTSCPDQFARAIRLSIK